MTEKPVKLSVLLLGLCLLRTECAADPPGTFAYVANALGDNVSAYSIGSNGTLTPIPGSPFAAGKYPVSVAVDPTSKFAYVANQHSYNVSAYSIGSNGALTPIPGSPFAAGKHPVSVAVDPASKFTYVANQHSNNVSAYSIGSNGALTPIPGSPFAAGLLPSSVAVDPTAKFAYVANGGNNVSAYSIGSNGALTPVSGSPFAAGDMPVSVAVGLESAKKSGVGISQAELTKAATVPFRRLIPASCSTSHTPHGRQHRTPDFLALSRRRRLKSCGLLTQDGFYRDQLFPMLSQKDRWVGGAITNARIAYESWAGLSNGEIRIEPEGYSGPVSGRYAGLFADYAQVAITTSV